MQDISLPQLQLCIVLKARRQLEIEIQEKKTHTLGVECQPPNTSTKFEGLASLPLFFIGTALKVHSFGPTMEPQLVTQSHRGNFIGLTTTTRNGTPA